MSTAIKTWLEGDYPKARSLYIEQQERFDLLGEKPFKSLCISQLGLLAMEEGDLPQARTYLEQALALWREAGLKPHIALRLSELSHLFYLEGNLEEFRQKFKESLSLRNHLAEFQKPYLLMRILSPLCLLKPESSARILGVLDNHERENHDPFSPVDKLYCGRAESHARKALGNAVFVSAFAEGQKLSLDEALDLALKTVQES